MGTDIEARGLQVGGGPVTLPPQRVAGVLPDVDPIGRVFDYLVPEHLAADVRVGTMVRVDLHGRRVGGWVVAVDRDPPPNVALKPIAKVTGWGPEPSLVDLATWAAWRWTGTPSMFLATASPPAAVRGLPAPRQSGPPATVVVDPNVAAVVDDALAAGGGIARLPPAIDLPAVAAHVVATYGPALVVCPSLTGAGIVAGRLRRHGLPVALLPREWAAARAGGVSIVGARSAAWGPAPDARAIVVLDGHDEAHQGEAAPTWHAAEVAIERATRAGVPWLVTMSIEDLALVHGRTSVHLARKHEREGWPIFDILDRRGDDPRTGLYSDRLVAMVRRAQRSVLVLNRKGRARLLACAACGELAKCERCAAAVVQDEAGLACLRCSASRPRVCASCGGSTLKNLRVGVTRAREELEAILQTEVGEVTGDTDEVPDTTVLIGTEAVLHRVPRVDLVGFLDIDQELLAPRYRAAEEALALLARAGRVVGGRAAGGRVAVQTRLPDHPVLGAVLHGDPARLAEHELPTRALLQFPPAASIAAVSGAAAPAFIDRLRAAAPLGLEILGPDADQWLVRAPDHRLLCDALASVERPSGRLRVRVDPRRL